ncbi:MAG: PASTA domain-containing protein [Pseudomonadota bacterium]
MTLKKNHAPNTEEYAGLTALPEFNAIARVGIMGIGDKLATARVQQLQRDADRAARRGKATRAKHLRKKVSKISVSRNAMKHQSEREQIREVRTEPDNLVLQGRLSEKGLGKAGLRLDLLDENGLSIGTAVTDKVGGFVIFTPKRSLKNTTMVVSDGSGGILQSSRLTEDINAFVELDLKGARSTVKPNDDTFKEIIKEEDDQNDVETKTIKMLQVVGLTMEEAQKRLSDAGFNVQIEKTATNEHAEGEVIDQSPEAGTDQIIGASVTLSIAVADMVSVPQVKTMMLDDAATSLQVAGLGFKILEDASSALPKGQVISQKPAFGDRVARGSIVELVVSVGGRKEEDNDLDQDNSENTFKMSDYVGKNFSETTIELGKLGLKIDSISYQLDAGNAGAISMHLPSKGTILKRKSPGTFSATVAVGKSKIDIASFFSHLSLDVGIRQAGISDDTLRTFTKHTELKTIKALSGLVELGLDEFKERFSDLPENNLEILHKVVREIGTSILEARNG